MTGKPLFVPLTCSSTSHPAIGRFLPGDHHDYYLVAASRQRPGSGTAGLGGGQGDVRGSFGTMAEYPGCPSCGADGFVRCGGCGQLSCQDGTWELFTCPVCGNQGKITGYIEALSTSEDS